MVSCLSHVKFRKNCVSKRIEEQRNCLKSFLRFTEIKPIYPALGFRSPGLSGVTGVKRAAGRVREDDSSGFPRAGPAPGQGRLAAPPREAAAREPRARRLTVMAWSLSFSSSVSSILEVRDRARADGAGVPSDHRSAASPGRGAGATGEQERSARGAGGEEQMRVQIRPDRHM